MDFTIWSDHSNWEAACRERRGRVVGYRRSSNSLYQEVILLPDGHYFYGLYMPEGFVPPEEVGSHQEEEG